jgi:hypothetical protein
MATDWIGFHTDYSLKQLGLSQKRAEWVSNWCSKLVTELRVLPAEMMSGLGRLGYAANALFWEKPFLGPLYAWTAAISKRNGIAKVPWAIAMILNWIGERLQQGGRLQPPPSLLGDPIEMFRTDAKAEGGRAYIGGWETLFTKHPAEARWFSFEVTRQHFPWVWCKEKDPGRVIAALELLGTIMAVMLFSNKWPANSSGWTHGTGLTDNRGNSFAVQKMLSTKFPLTVLLIELSEQLRACSIELHLQWVRREENQEADDLTNENFTKFSEQNRITVPIADLKWAVLPRLMSSGQSLYEKIVDMKKSRNSARFCSQGKARKRKRENLLEGW